jgi:hypothetical protein
MGMIAFVCLPMQLGLEVVIVPPDDFLRRPIIWAELISRHRATITSALCVLGACPSVTASEDSGSIDLCRFGSR